MIIYTDLCNHSLSMFCYIPENDENCPCQNDFMPSMVWELRLQPSVMPYEESCVTFDINQIQHLHLIDT